MSDFDDSFEVNSTDSNEDNNSEDYEDEEYEYSRRRYYRGYDFYDDYEPECKKCKTDNAYEFVTVKPVIFTSVSKLQDIATVSVAASLWNHENIPEAVFLVTDRCAKKSQEWRNLCTKVFSSTSELPVPKSITELIDIIIRKMAIQIPNWVSYHYKRVFLENGLDKYVYSHVYHIVWSPNGTINCEQTARSMQTSLRLSEIEKFKFLCTYCLEEEIEEMSPLLYLKTVLDHVTFQTHPLIYYWYCYFRNTPQKITDAVCRLSNLSVDVYMFQNTNVDNWSAKEYFFNHLNADEQVRQAVWLIDAYAAVYQKAVLMKLDETQRLHVYIQRALPIMINYSHPRVSSKLILSTWFEARHLLTQDDFFSLLCKVLQNGVNDFALTEIWCSAPDEFKDYVRYLNDYEIVKKVLLSWRWRHDSDFIFVLLQDSSVVIKQHITTSKFFVEYCESLIDGKFQWFDRLLEFLLPDGQECISFKLNLMKNSRYVEKTCERLYSSGDIDGLNEFLNKLVGPFPECIAEYKRYLLNTTKDLFDQCCENLLKNDKLQGLDQLLGFFISNAQVCLSFKLDLVSNSKYVKDTCLHFYSSGDAYGLNKFLNKYMASFSHCIIDYKKHLRDTTLDWFVKSCEELLKNGQIRKVDELLEFLFPDALERISFRLNLVNNSSYIKNTCLSLCSLGNVDGLNDFLNEHMASFPHQIASYKKNLFITSKDAFTNCCGHLLRYGLLQSLDDLLVFFLSDSKERSEFKLHLVNTSKFIRVMCLNFYSSGDTNGLNNFLNQHMAWFPNFIMEYKTKLLNSKTGMKKCISLIVSQDEALEKIIGDNLPDTNSVTEFKRQMLLSKNAIARLRELILTNHLNEVQSCIQRFVTSSEDIRQIKKEMFGDCMTTIREILCKNDESYLQSALLWCYGNENLLQFRKKINIDLEFCSMLKDCIFATYDKYLTKCVFNINLSSDLEVLDRFLNWYFESPIKVKEYKMKMIRSYQRINTFTTLLRGKRGDTQLKIMLGWFFQNDTTEIRKFKSNCAAANSKILGMI